MISMDKPFGHVVAVSVSPTHAFSKANVASIRLLEGLGVEGDAHCGATVKHRSRVAKNPDQPNLRQVHLIHAELMDEVGIAPGEMGENVATRGIDLLGLPTGTLLHLGESAVVEVTGLRNPCGQIENFRPGLLKAMLDRDADGNLVRKAGVMAVVRVGGEVKPGDTIRVQRPDGEPRPLECV